MIRVNLLHVMRLRGIERPYTYLRKIGLTHKMASCWATGFLKRIDLGILGKVCFHLNCAPHDILELRDSSLNLPEGHPLLVLKPKPYSMTVKDLLQNMPKDEVEDLIKELIERKKGAL